MASQALLGSSNAVQCQASTSSRCNQASTSKSVRGLPVPTFTGRCSAGQHLNGPPKMRLSGALDSGGRHQQLLGVSRAAATLAPDFPVGERVETVGDIMTSARDTHIWTVHADTSIDEALELLVGRRVTGLPVVDDDNVVVGIVSDFDLLSMDSILGTVQKIGIFPDTNTDWKAFGELNRIISKNAGKTVADVMTEEPVVVRSETNVEAAARILLERKIRRLPVVDEAGRLIGMFSRRDVIKTALASRQRALRS